MATSEIVVNEYLGAELRRRYSSWQTSGVVSCESTEAFAAKSKRPDLIVCDNPMSPVGVETEFIPANSVEKDATSRLGKTYLPTGGVIHSVIAVRIPVKYRKLSDAGIAHALAAEDNLQFCLLSGSSDTEHSRWPRVGFVSGSVVDLANVIASARVSPVTISTGAKIMEEGARLLAAMLQSASTSNPGLGSRIAEYLKQESGFQTFTMASTILINAFVFQETLAHASTELANIKSIYDFGSGTLNPTKKEVIAEWDEILKINYWPIFGVSKRLIAAVPSAMWEAFSKACLGIADKLVSLNLGKNPDLIGTIFQRLISDRRFLATFYTAPSSAALLARFLLGPKMPHGGSWSEVEHVKGLMVADFACGTGSLLCTLYADLRAHVENAGGNSRSLHRWMVENCLVGCDVLPSATYITASQLSSAFPTIQYTNTKILTLPFGRVTDGGVSLGALELLETQGAMSTIATSAESIGPHADTEVDAWKALGGAAVHDQGFDLIVMNPPFTRLTGGGGKTAEISRPLFAAFGTSTADQKAMARKAAKLLDGTSYHGNAGAASAFVEIGHRKLKYGGRIGLILPVNALSGVAWEGCRSLWRKHYTDIIILSIASDEPEASAFSADTGVAECMFIGTRTQNSSGRLMSATLYRRPASTLEGSEVARLIRSLAECKGIRDIEDGPLGGTPLYIGDEKIGEAILSRIPSGPWLLSRIYDHTLAQVAFQMSTNGVVWLPGLDKLSGVQLCKLSKLGTPGPYHLDVSGSALSGGAPRGPFELVPTDKPSAVTYPALKAHDEQRERCLEIEPDSEGIARNASGDEAKKIVEDRRNAIWATRTRLHFSTDLRFNANALTACLTSRESLGGRAWPSFLLSDRKFEKLVALWFNSTLGILIFWWMSSKAQDGRGSVTTSRLGELVCVDPQMFDDQELAEIDQFFDDFKSKPLLDVFECASDPNRDELDRFAIRHLLKVPPKQLHATADAVQLVRAKLALEPSIHGGRNLADSEEDGGEDK